MMNPFRDQEKFMKACDQTVEEYNHGQVALYANLIKEEFEEFNLDNNTITIKNDRLNIVITHQ